MAELRAPYLVVLAGPNGAGKTTYYERVLQPATHLPFVNADRIAARRWPRDSARHAYEAARIAARRRTLALDQGRSFVTETVFSHPSKLDLLREAKSARFQVHLHVLLIPEELAVARVALRVETGGHPVPEDKIRHRYRRLWRLIGQAIPFVDRTEILDNSRAARPFRPVARYENGELVVEGAWPSWTPAELR